MTELRDMRHFNGQPLAGTILSKILAAPSVRLMQPWLFIRIENHETKQTIHKLVDKECRLTVEALGKREQDVLKLKVEGML